MHFVYSLKYFNYNDINKKSDEFMNKYIFILTFMQAQRTELRSGLVANDLLSYSAGS